MLRTHRPYALCLVSGTLAIGGANGEKPDDAFDGSYRLETGEVVTGGYFVEGARGSYIFMDTDALARGGLFERVGDTRLRSIAPTTHVTLEFTLADDGTIDGLVWRDDDGAPPVRGERIAPHESRPVRFDSADGTRLDGRLLLPRCDGPHAAVVAVHGSGPVNRYGGPYDLFFLKHGVAVLAYDKRGYTDVAGAWREPDLAQLSADAAAAMRFAATQPELDADRIGFFGSSQAGWVVPSAAVDAEVTDFIILRAGAATSHLDTHLYEVRQELRAAGLRGLELDHADALRREVYELALRGGSIAGTDRLVAPYLDAPWYRAAFGDGPISGRWSERWWTWIARNFAVAATPSLERFDGQVLWFLGELDENVPLVATRAALERALDAAPTMDHEIVVLEGAVHSFLVPSADGPPRFSSGFFGHMADWMRERGLTNDGCWDDPPATRGDR